MPAEERLARSIGRLAEALGAPGFTPRLHPHDRVGRWARTGRGHVRASVGVTPFRPGDAAARFYESPKFRRFTQDMRRLARQRSVKIDRVEKAVGVWEGETEPSLAVDAHDHEAGVEAWAAELGKRYDQDGVLLFEPSAAGDSAAYRLDVAGHRDEALGAMGRHGIPGGRLVGDQLELVGKGAAFHDRVDALARDVGAHYDATVGRMNLLERDGYDEAIRRAEPR